MVAGEEKEIHWFNFFLFFYLSFHISCSCVPFWSCIWSGMSGGHTGSCWLWRSSAVRNVANEEKCWKKASVPIKTSHIFSLFVSTLHGRSFPLSLLILLHSSSLVLSARTGTLYLQESGGKKNAFSCFYHQEFIVQTILCLMPLQRLTSVCLELQVIFLFFPTNLNNDFYTERLSQHCHNTPSKHFILFPWWVQIHSFTCFNLNIYLNAVKANISCSSCWKQPFLLLKGPVRGIYHTLAVRMNTANK